MKITRHTADKSEILLLEIKLQQFPNANDVGVSLQILETTNDIISMIFQHQLFKRAVPAPRPISLVRNQMNNKMKFCPYNYNKRSIEGQLNFLHVCTMALVSEISLCFSLDSVILSINVFLTSTRCKYFISLR